MIGAYDLLHVADTAVRSTISPLELLDPLDIQATARAEWLAERETALLPVEYFHVVFTLPQEIARAALQNPSEIYRLLFCALSETLLTIAADPKRSGR